MKYLLDNGTKSMLDICGIVESNYGFFEDKVQYCKKYSAHMLDSPLSLMNTRHNKLERRQNLVGGPQHQMIVLLTSLMVWILVLPFFRLKTSVSCAMLSQKSSEVIEGVDAILL